MKIDQAWLQTMLLLLLSQGSGTANAFPDGQVSFRHRREQDQGQEPEGLWTLPYYANLRRTAAKVERKPSSHLEFVTHQDLDEELPICHLDAIIGFTTSKGDPSVRSSQRGGIIAMAAHHLNTGYAKVVPDLEGLPERCPIRFTVEGGNSGRNQGIAMETLREHVSRAEDPNSEKPAPCVVLGNTYSSVSKLTSTVTGFLQIPQISGTATSPSLDDTIVSPLFGRSVPSDQGIAVTVLQFFSQVLGAKHLNIVHSNDNVQTAMVESIRQAIPEYAPDMVLHQVIMSSESATKEVEAVRTLKLSRYRYTLCLVIDGSHVELYKQAVDSGMAGDGLHQWFFTSDASPTSMIADAYPPDSHYYDFFQGVGEIRLFSGEPGMPVFDALVAEAAALPKLPANRPILEDFFADIYDQDYIQNEILGPDSMYMQGDAVARYEPFVYDAVVAAGLAACKAWELQGQNLTFTGVDHFNAFKQSSFQGVTGKLSINNVTGTRDPTSAFYRVINFRREKASTEDGQENLYTFLPATTHTYEGGTWVQQDAYIFNDGTSNIPVDMGPPLVAVVDDSLSTEAMVGICVAAFSLLAMVYFILREWRRKANDMLWRINEKEIVFEQPPEVLGRGTFGEVFLAEYRGTKVAVKRLREREEMALEEPQTVLAAARETYTYKDKSDDSSTALDNEQSEDVEHGYSGYGGVSSASFHSRGSKSFVAKGKKQAKDDLIQEMRLVSGLRHPCVATIMGAVVEGKSPMLVMEYMDLGSLYEVLHNPTIFLDGTMKASILSDITQGMRFLHYSTPEVIHGDLKAQNVLVDSHFRAKVTDFGLSQKTQIKGGTGTPFWMAPELLRGESTNTKASDIFSFGVLMFELCTGKEPYEGEKGRDVVAAIKDKHIKKRVALPSNMAEKTRSIILDCMEEDPNARTTFDEISSRLKRFDASALVTSLKKPERLRNTVLPDHIVEVLKKGGQVKRERKTNVTLVSCQIANLDAIMEKLSYVKMMSVVSRLQTILENLAEKHGVFLLETDGNTFMAASNLVQEQSEDHSKRMVAFALDAVQLANKTSIDDLGTNASSVEVLPFIKVGLHVGSVSAGVLGSKRPRYTLFGEDVHIADLMAHHSKMGMIHCSPEAKLAIYKQSGDEVQLKVRTDGASVKLRFRGKVNTYWLSRKEAGYLDTLVRVRAQQRLRLNHSMASDEAKNQASIQENAEAETVG